MPEFLAGIAAPEFAIAAVIAVLGGMVHGYTGFGAGLVMVPFYALLFGPVETIGVIFISGLLASARVYPRAARLARWRELAPMVAAFVVATPLGALVLFNADADLVRRIMSLLVLLAAALLLSGWTWRGQRGAAAGMVAGGLSGAINGVAGVGGPPIVAYFLAAPDSADVQRANIMMALGISVVVTIVVVAIGGGVGTTTIARSVVIAPVQAAGFWAGARLFVAAPQAFYRRIALLVLIDSGVSGLAL